MSSEISRLPREPRQPTALPRTRAERREATRRRLIDATIACLASVGYFDTTTTLVAERAEVSRGALQHHFRTRDDLFLAVIERVGQELMEDFDSELAPKEPVIDRLTRVCRTYWKVYRSDAYLAQLQIWLGAQNDQQLQRNIERITRRMANAQQRLWSASFFDLKVPDNILFQMRSLTISAVRGLAMRPARPLRQGQWPPEIDALCAMIAKELTDGPLAARSRAG